MAKINLLQSNAKAKSVKVGSAWVFTHKDGENKGKPRLDANGIPEGLSIEFQTQIKNADGKWETVAGEKELMTLNYGDKLALLPNRYKKTPAQPDFDVLYFPPVEASAEEAASDEEN
jgi:uncharacterized protein (DUF736 family)